MIMVIDYCCNLVHFIFHTSFDNSRTSTFFASVKKVSSIIKIILILILRFMKNKYILLCLSFSSTPGFKNTTSLTFEGDTGAFQCH